MGSLVRAQAEERKEKAACAAFFDVAFLIRALPIDFKWIITKTWGLGINFSKTEKEKSNIPNASQLRPEGFDFTFLTTPSRLGRDTPPIPAGRRGKILPSSSSKVKNYSALFQLIILLIDKKQRVHQFHDVKIVLMIDNFKEHIRRI